MKYVDEFRNSAAVAVIRQRIQQQMSVLANPATVNVMEVCGSHTMAIARYGIRPMLPSTVNLVSGPGCPVCVTDAGYIDNAISLAERGIILVSFGDMVNVPGTSSTLAACRTSGGNVKVCYSPEMALELALEHPDKEVVFLAIGFETTIGPALSIINSAAKQQIRNLSILTAFKQILPALTTLAEDQEANINGFLCPAHVSAVIGTNAYCSFAEKYRLPCVIAGFEPLDILSGLSAIIAQINSNRAEVENLYTRVVKPEGNQLILALFEKYLNPADAWWRGIGNINGSGFKLKPEYSHYDAAVKFSLNETPRIEHTGCRCGDVLKGKINPRECPFFANSCTPEHPVGPCMVSSEGSCAAAYKYN
jgi:hydrogenase expression/formation protein HypD